MKSIKKTAVLAITSAAVLLSGNAMAAQTAEGAVRKVSGLANTIGQAIPALALVVGGILAFYFFILLNKKADDQRGDDVSMSKLILTGLAAGGLLGYGATSGIFTSLIV